MSRPVLIVCMGVSGCGKTTVAKAVAESAGLRFIEADDFHSAENRERMASGIPLDDAGRRPWIARVCEALEKEREAGNDCVLACSALRKAYRDRFRAVGFRTRFLFLDGERELIAGWMRRREGHYMPVSLLDSQFEALERPEIEPDVRRITLSPDWETVTSEAIDSALCLIRS